MVPSSASPQVICYISGCGGCRMAGLSLQSWWVSTFSTWVGMLSWRHCWGTLLRAVLEVIKNAYQLEITTWRLILTWSKCLPWLFTKVTNFCIFLYSGQINHTITWPNPRNGIFFCFVPLASKLWDSCCESRREKLAPLSNISRDEEYQMPCYWLKSLRTAMQSFPPFLWQALPKLQSAFPLISETPLYISKWNQGCETIIQAIWE